MKNTILVLTILVLMILPLYAQGAGVKKFPGETINFSWVFATTDESKISGFKIYSGINSTGPFTYTGTSAVPTARSTTLPAAFPTGSTAVFFVIRSYYTGTSSTVESSDSNTTEVDLNVPTPTAFQAK